LNISGSLGLGNGTLFGVNGTGAEVARFAATTSDRRLKDVRGKYQYGLEEVLKLEKDNQELREAFCAINTRAKICGNK